jgi:hypothetical protein
MPDYEQLYTDLLAAIKTVNKYHPLGDAIYSVRDRADMITFEGNSWEHPDVKAYSEAWTVIDNHLKD